MAFENPEQFHNRGRDIITDFAKMVDEFKAYAATFEARGGAAALGQEYGQKTEAFVVLHNDLVAFLDQNDRDRLLAEYRTDY